ncbi:MAG: hypothetical protein Q8T08_21015, partial [Ignavibacteria bacterium]|nr:hypothetical protein [Ignavibacteria bacterium]
EKNSENENIANRYDTSRNEKILMRKSIISGTVAVIFVSIVFFVAYSGIVTVHHTVLTRIVLTVVTLLVYPIIYFTSDYLHRFLWLKVQNRQFDISGIWYIIQTEPNNKSYLRFGTVRIGQNYFNIHMDAETYSVVYDSVKDSLLLDESKFTTHWFEDSVLDEQGKLYGTYQSARSDGTYLYGLHVLDLGNVKNRKPDEVRGWYIDSTSNAQSHIRRGNKMMFRHKNDRDEHAKEMIHNGEVIIP